MKKKEYEWNLLRYQIAKCDINTHLFCYSVHEPLSVWTETLSIGSGGKLGCGDGLIAENSG